MTADLAPIPRPVFVDEIELELLLEGIYRRWGFDFRDYARASLMRRVVTRVAGEGVESISALQEKLLRDEAVMERFLVGLTVHVTAMFRDPEFYRAFREKVVPVLKTYPFVRVWCAGCSTGEEVYSLAILLDEEGLADRCRIYATDLSEAVLAEAKKGVFPLASMKAYTANYIEAGGKRSFSEYYTASHDHAILRPSLRDGVVFAQHNLVCDGSPNEFNAIVCRNVMIYFNRALQERVLRLFHGSLARFGFLCLGRKESLRFTAFEGAFEVVDAAERTYRAIGRRIE